MWHPHTYCMYTTHTEVIASVLVLQDLPLLFIIGMNWNWPDPKTDSYWLAWAALNSFHFPDRICWTFTASCAFLDVCLVNMVYHKGLKTDLDQLRGAHNGRVTKTQTSPEYTRAKKNSVILFSVKWNWLYVTGKHLKHFSFKNTMFNLYYFVIFYRYIQYGHTQ